ncbi:S-adenosyl-L-methionine-dependent methyltransferase [Lepidopterella palustris CBS 459.81]|uniref:DNA (cytosine-5-)-methyltransferase n=1 Tax=Lepidopterella palustris CBS 459.81 TaxID=1314670 RepID=A0A8E2E745_9PEZI|nr:S-adenosyl-L-methionine-dependent methyltransferase [Lepidopterella palustris CBS 459.81]
MDDTTVEDLSDDNDPHISHMNSDSFRINKGLGQMSTDVLQNVNNGKVLHYITPGKLICPKSQYQNWTPPIPATSEDAAIKDLKARWNLENDSRREEPYVVFQLSDFSIYRTGLVYRAFEMDTLDSVATSGKGTSTLLFDGMLSVGSTTRYVTAVPFEILSIEGYGDAAVSTVSKNIYIQSLSGKNQNVWYQLNAPSPEYKPYYDPFLWLADFAKHFVDFLDCHFKVHLRDFEKDFCSWVTDRHSGSDAIAKWLASYHRTDYRSQVTAHSNFLYKEAFGVNADLIHEPIWDECCVLGRSAVPEQPRVMTKTTTTPFVYEHFKDMYFGYRLSLVQPTEQVMIAREMRMKSLGFVADTRGNKERNMPRSPTSHPGEPVVGDVVGVARDEGKKWGGSSNVWLAYAQRTERTASGELQLNVLWLYHPTDTTISTKKYLVEKEFFMSDNCNCSSQPLKASDVIYKFTVDFFPSDLNTKSDYLVRQTYITENHSFVTLDESHFRCTCRREKKSPRTLAFELAVGRLKIGDGVYVRQRSRHNQKQKSTLEPAVVVGFNSETKEIKFRRLLRRGRDCADMSEDHRCRGIRPNELVWTKDFFNVPATEVKRKCHIRFYPLSQAISQNIPSPYNCGGAGDCWYICTSLTGTENKKRLELLEAPFPSSLNQGFDPTSPPTFTPMEGLSIFSGGGSFDRGLEEGGAVTFRKVVDISGPAVHTHRANSRTVGDTDIYWGSVDDYLLALLKGTDVELIAQIGEIAFIAGGSPCPGFSQMQPNWKSDQSCMNASHITSIASFVDIHRPKYALLENVANMAATRKGHEEEKVLSQLIGCFVAMGYQVKQFLVDSWCVASSQLRSRLFVSIAAPGLTPLPVPPLTHSHPPEIKGRCLGKHENGEPFGEREFCDTPFEFVTAAEATKDLPPVGQCVQICVPFPDHRLHSVPSRNDRELMKKIPTKPTGKGLAYAVEKGYAPQHMIGNREPGKALTRIEPHRLFPTLTTKPSARDAYVGRILHWDEPRVITIQEARRAQGIPDEEVIIGSRAQQWEIIGNGVDRCVSRALGMSLRWALLANASDDAPEETSNTQHSLLASKLPKSSSPVATPEVISISSQLLNGMKKAASLASMFVAKSDSSTPGGSKTRFTESVPFRRDRVVQREESVEETLETISIISETRIENNTRFPVCHKDSHNSTLELASSETARLGNIRENESLNRKTKGLNKRLRSEISASREQDSHKRTRRSGHVAEFSPSDWSKPVERLIRKD